MVIVLLILVGYNFGKGAPELNFQEEGHKNRRTLVQ